MSESVRCRLTPHYLERKINVQWISKFMLKKILLTFLWLSFIGYAFFFAPPNQPDTFRLIQNLSIGNWQGINPLVISLFNLMGVWPLIYSGLLYADGRMQKIPAWPFAIGTFFLGAFFLLPYLILRQPAPQFEGKKTRLIQFFDARWLGGFTLIVTLILLIYGFAQGDFSNFVEQWKTNRFIHVMSLDFCLLGLLFPVLLKDDLSRRYLKNPLWFWLISGLPLIGSALYLALRPSLVSCPEKIES